MLDLQNYHLADTSCQKFYTGIYVLTKVKGENLIILTKHSRAPLVFLEQNLNFHDKCHPSNIMVDHIHVNTHILFIHFNLRKNTMEYIASTNWLHFKKQQRRILGSNRVLNYAYIITCSRTTVHQLINKMQMRLIIENWI